MDRVINYPAVPAAGPGPYTPAKGGAAGKAAEGGISFERVLLDEVGKDRDLKISAHAAKRLKERNIVLAREDLVKIDQAVRRAGARGARESLIIYGDLALIASVKNKTVVTALDGGSAQNHIFTNIDSAVIVK